MSGQLFLKMETFCKDAFEAGWNAFGKGDVEESHTRWVKNRFYDDDDYADWLAGEKVKLALERLRAFQERLNVQIHAKIDAECRVLKIAKCIRESFAEGLDEGVSMDIARKIDKIQEPRS